MRATVSSNAAHRVLRVIVAAGGDIGALYTAFGTKYHIFGDDFDDELIPIGTYGTEIAG
ncbi:MAG: hypothetical protein WDN27_05120 [Candidatus Saccharibacteria bacterium]